LIGYFDFLMPQKLFFHFNFLKLKHNSNKNVEQLIFPDYKFHYQMAYDIFYFDVCLKENSCLIFFIVVYLETEWIFSLKWNR